MDTSSSATVPPLPGGIANFYFCECEAVSVSVNSQLALWFRDMDHLVDVSLYPKHLDLHRNQLGDRGTVALAKTLRGMQWLKSIDLRNCGVAASGVAELCDTLKTHRSLNKIDLRGNEVFATSARRLVKLIRERNDPLLVVCDLHELPNRIAKELLQAMGRTFASVNSFERVTQIPYPQLLESNAAQSFDAERTVAGWRAMLPVSETTEEDTEVGAESRAAQFVSEMIEQEASVMKLYSQLGPLMPHLCFDFGASRVVSYATRLQRTVKTVAELSTCTSLLAQTALRVLPPSVILTSTLPFTSNNGDGAAGDSASTSSGSDLVPCASDEVWRTIADVRGSLLSEQWSTILSVVRQRLGDGTSKSNDSSQERMMGDGTNKSNDTSQERMMDDVDGVSLLSHVISEVVATSGKDLSFFSPIEKHLDAVYRQVITVEYEEKRELSLLCHQLSYLIANHKGEHRSWCLQGSTLRKPARVDRGALQTYVNEHMNDDYGSQRLKLVRAALEKLPTLMVDFILDVVGESAVAKLYESKNVHISVFAQLLREEDPSTRMHEGSITLIPSSSLTLKPTPPPLTATRSQASSAVVQQRPSEVQNFVVMNDVATVLGSIRNVDQLQLLIRRYGQWLRWQFLCGNISVSSLQLL